MTSCLVLNYVEPFTLHLKRNRDREECTHFSGPETVSGGVFQLDFNGFQCPVLVPDTASMNGFCILVPVPVLVSDTASVIYTIYINLTIHHNGLFTSAIVRTIVRCLWWTWWGEIFSSAFFNRLNNRPGIDFVHLRAILFGWIPIQIVQFSAILLSCTVCE